MEINASKFKERCLYLLEHLGPEGIVVTKRGKPVARVLPLGGECRGLIGLFKGKLKINGDILSTGLRWDADAEP